jgi:HD-like signal output (HDOD) protein
VTTVTGPWHADHQLTPEQQESFDALVREVKELRPLPTIALRLVAMGEDSRFSAQDLAGTIQTDQALTMKILRLANSAAFGLPRRVKSLREAIVLLGFRDVRSMALAGCVVEDGVRERIAGALLDYDLFWVNSLVVAHFAQVLAEHEEVDRDEAFTAGVVHNIGRLAMAQQRPEWIRHVTIASRDTGRPVHDLQREQLGFTDADLGAAIARQLSFPQPLVDAVERHAWPLSQLGQSSDLDVIVAKARRLARANALSDSVDIVGRRLAPDEDWKRPRVEAALLRFGGVEGVINRARDFLTETEAA